MLSYTIIYYTMRCCAILSYTILYDTMLCYTILSHTKLREEEKKLQITRKTLGETFTVLSETMNRVDMCSDEAAVSRALFRLASARLYATRTTVLLVLFIVQYAMLWYSIV